MKNSNLILFESLNASFRLSINTMFEKIKQDGSTQPTVYLNPKNDTGSFRPSCFLVFTYLTDDYMTSKGVYTTVPHMYKIRTAFQEMFNILHADGTYIIDPNTNSLMIAPAVQNSIVVDNLSKNNDWIALTPATYKDQSNISRPAVAISHSKSNNFSSLLTADEFDAINDLIQHLDMISIENQAVIMELLTRSNSRPSYPSPAIPNYSQPVVNQPRRNVGVPSPAVQTRPVTPNYNYQPQVRQQVSQQVQTQPVQEQANVPLAPRPAEMSRPKINMEALSDIPVDDIDLSDEEAINNIFNAEE